jgi:hypothetical protein
MQIGLVGGLDRNHRQYVEAAARAGHSLEHHTGHMAGRGSGTLASLVERSDVVIVVTEVNSHGAMWEARRQSRAFGRPCVLVRRLGMQRFRALLEKLTDNPAELALAAASGF